MKAFKTALCIVILVLCAACVYPQKRQTEKPTLFSDLPATINFPEAQLAALFTAEKGQRINLKLADNLVFSGPVTSNLVKYSNLQTVLIQLTAFKNTFFSLSKQTDNNNQNIYVGKILNPLYSDGFELKHGAKGNYQLVKINVEKIIVNCNLK